MPILPICYNPDCMQAFGVLKRCNGCEHAWYCNSACQRSHWVEHLFSCKPRRPITTADHLALAIYKSIWPADGETRRDYGFSKSLEGDGKRKILSLWTILLHNMKINPQTVHKWRVDGNLLQEIQRAFSESVEFRDSEVHAWFMENQHLFDPTYTPADTAEDCLNSSPMISGWVLSGGSPHDTHEQIATKIRRLPRDLAACHIIYGMVLDDYLPPSGTPLWMYFGFCAAHFDGLDGMEVCHLYRQLITTCTFEEFFRAFITSSLTHLFRSYGLVINRYMEDVFSDSPGQLKSIWHLKQYVHESLTKPDGGGQGLSQRVSVDYGFINCHDEEDLFELRNLYGIYLCRKDADPLQLHEACMSGKLYDFLTGVIKLWPKSRYVRLLNNPYPAKGCNT